MKKQLANRIILSTLFISTPALIPFVVLSATQNQTSLPIVSTMGVIKMTNPQLATSTINDEEKEQPDDPVTIEQINENKKVVSIKIATNLASVIDSVLKILDERIEQIKSNSKADDVAKLTDVFYLSQLKKWLNNNKSSIIADSSKIGIDPVFLKMFGEDDKFNLGSIEFSGEKFSGVVWGNKQQTDYSIPTKNAPKTKESDFSNTLAGDKLIKTINTYFEALNSEMLDIFLNEKDIPKNGVDFEILVENIDGRNVLTASPPLGKEGISSWEQYIQNQIGMRYTIFDIKTNIKLNARQSVPPNEEDEELVVEGEDITKEILPRGFDINKLTNLQPWVIYENTSLTIAEFFKKFNSLSQDEKQELIFFENPISSRFVYTVESLNQTDGKLIASVKLVDKLKPSDSRNYESEIKNLNLDEKNAFGTFLKYSSHLRIKDLFEKIFNTIGVPKNLNFDVLESSEKKRIFNLIYAITKIVFSKKFVDIRENNINNSLSEYGSSSLQSLIETVQEKSENLFLDYLKTTRINNKNLLIVFVSIFNDRIEKIKKNIKQSSEFEDSLNVQNISKNDLIDAFNYMENKKNAINTSAISEWINNSWSFRDLINDAYSLNTVYLKSNNLFNALIKKQEIKNEISEFNQVVNFIRQPRKNVLIATLVFMMLLLASFIGLMYKKIRLPRNSSGFLKTKTAIAFFSTFVISTLAMISIAITILIFGGL